MRYSHYIAKKNVAKDGVFNSPGLTPLDSVGRAGVFDVLQYMTAEIIEMEEMTKKK